MTRVCGKRSEQVLVPAGRDQQPWPAAGRGRAVQRRDDLLDDRGRVSCFIEGIDHHREYRPREERVREFCAGSNAETRCEFGEQLVGGLASCQQRRGDAAGRRYRAGIGWGAWRLRCRACVREGDQAAQYRGLPRAGIPGEHPQPGICGRVGEPPGKLRQRGLPACEVPAGLRGDLDAARLGPPVLGEFRCVPAAQPITGLQVHVCRGVRLVARVGNEWGQPSGLRHGYPAGALLLAAALEGWR